MKVLNVHRRIIHQSKDRVGDLLDHISTPEDPIWPHEQWPKLKLDRALHTGSKGGHGPIRYFVKQYIPGERIEFEFTYPKGFHGSHWVEVKELEKKKSEIIHTIKMNATGKDILAWAFVVRPLHNALIEDAFDKIENLFEERKKKTKWSPWVKFCRRMLKTKRK